MNYRCSLRQRDRAAFLAMAERFSADNFLALAFPPLIPPVRPILARYSDIGERSSVWVSSSVERRTISAALWFTSSGSLLERLMHCIMPQLYALSSGKMKKPS